MIVTVTLNPAVDKTADLSEFNHGGLNRLTNIVRDAGGKGINVSKTIKALGGETIATGFIGGSTGSFIESTLSEQGIKVDFVSVHGETRTNLKVVEQNGFVTELNESGPQVTEAQIEELEENLVSYAGTDTLYVFAGRIPKSVPMEAYSNMVMAVTGKSSKIFFRED